MPDGDGWRVERGPEFTRRDIDLMLAARAAEDAISPRGIEWRDELDPKARFHVGDEQGLPGKNFALEAIDTAKKIYAEKYPGAEMGNLVWPVKVV